MEKPTPEEVMNKNITGYRGSIKRKDALRMMQIYVEPYIKENEELKREVTDLKQKLGGVYLSPYENQCENCTHQADCRFKNENINNTCKFFIKI